MKSASKKRDNPKTTVLKTSLKTPEAITEDQLIDNLRSAYYTNRPPPDDRFWLAVSRKMTRLILMEAEAAKQPQATLFLRHHYPFFDDKVQAVLRERHPNECQVLKRSPEYAIEAYLLAEQYALLSLGKNIYKSLDLIEGPAQFYFLTDISWFPRLLEAVGDAVMAVRLSLDPESTGGVLQLQAYNNEFSESDNPPGRWFKDSEYLADIKKSEKQKVLGSKRVTANRENKKRKDIFKLWSACWKAQLEVVNRRIHPL